MRKPNPKSNRSQKKAIANGLKKGDHVMALVAMADFKVRRNHRDGRYSPKVNDDDVAKVYGLQGSKVVNTAYKADPNFQTVYAEAVQLYRDYIGHDKLTLAPKNFINSAYLNVTADGWQERKLTPGKMSLECQAWLKKQRKTEDNSNIGVTSNGQQIHKINKK